MGPRGESRLLKASMCLFPSPFSELIYSEYVVILDLVKHLLNVQWVVVHDLTDHMQI